MRPEHQFTYSKTTKYITKEFKMDIQEAYIAMQEASGIKEGDTVKVLRKAKEGEMGWDNTWEHTMDSFIGKECVVKNIADTEGIRLSGGDSYNFPFFVLELIKPKFAVKAGQWYTYAETGERFMLTNYDDVNVFKFAYESGRVPVNSFYARNIENLIKNKVIVFEAQSLKELIASTDE